MPDRQDDMSATDLVANAVSERLQLSGERDRLKTILMEELRNQGWTEVMYKVATKAIFAHQVETEHESLGSADDRQPLTAHQLAQLIAKQGHGSSFTFFFAFLFISFLLTPFFIANILTLIFISHFCSHIYPSLRQ